MSNIEKTVKKIEKIISNVKTKAKVDYVGSDLEGKPREDLLHSMWYRHTRSNQKIQDLIEGAYDDKKLLIETLETSILFEELYKIEFIVKYGWDESRLFGALEAYNKVHQDLYTDGPSNIDCDCMENTRAVNNVYRDYSRVTNISNFSR